MALPGPSGEYAKIEKYLIFGTIEKYFCKLA